MCQCRVSQPAVSDIQTVTYNNGIYSSAARFEDLNLRPDLLQGLYTEMKFEKPSRVQAKTLPMILTPPYRHLIAQVTVQRHYCTQRTHDRRHKALCAWQMRLHGLHFCWCMRCSMESARTPCYLFACTCSVYVACCLLAVLSRVIPIVHVLRTQPEAASACHTVRS